MYSEKGPGNVLSWSPWGLRAAASPTSHRGEGKARRLRARTYRDPALTQIILVSWDHNGFPPLVSKG